MSGNQPEDPDARYCEVIQVGIEDDTAEVTIFYTPEGEFQVFNGNVFESKEEYRNGRSYHRLKIVTSKANLLEVKRYRDNGEYTFDASGDDFYYDGRKVKL